MSKGADFLPEDAVLFIVRDRRGPQGIKADVVGGHGGSIVVTEDSVGLDEVCVVLVLSGHDAPSQRLDHALGQVALLRRCRHRDNDGAKRQHAGTQAQHSLTMPHLITLDDSHLKKCMQYTVEFFSGLHRGVTGCEEHGRYIP